MSEHFMDGKFGAVFEVQMTAAELRQIHLDITLYNDDEKTLALAREILGDRFPVNFMSGDSLNIIEEK